MASQAVTVSANDRDDDVARAADADRFRNQARQSPESLAQSVQELEAAIRSLEDRVASMNADLTYQIDTVERHGDQATRQLALEVAELGEALSRRIQAGSAGAGANAPVRRSRPVNRLTLGLSGALVAALTALGWVLFHHPAAVAAPKAPAPVAPALYAPTPPTPAAVPAAASDDPAPAPPPHHAAARPTIHHWAPAKAAPGPKPTDSKAAAAVDTPAAPASRSVSTPSPTDPKGAAPSPP